LQRDFDQRGGPARDRGDPFNSAPYSNAGWRSASITVESNMSFEFALFDTLPRNLPDEPAEIFAQKLGNAKLAEDVGYKYVFFIEHQNSAFPAITSSNVYLAAMAQATSTLRFGPLVFQLPLHHPIRLAQDVATVDQISRGRVEFGFGYGTVSPEFEPWKINFAERREMGIEALEIIRKAWTSQKFSYEGKYWSFTDARAWPPPFQTPQPPMWMGAHSTTSIDYIAENNLNLAQNIETETTIAEKIAYFRNAWKKHNHPGPQPRTLLVRHVHVAETEEQARAEAEPYMLEGILGQFGVHRAASLLPEERTATMVQNAEIAVKTSQSFEYWIDQGLAFVGTPDTVASAIVAQQRRCGYNILAAYHQILGMPHELVRKSIKLFGERVIPQCNVPDFAPSTSTVA
jgi:alkanesulfonate monooxygenase SsuD/methylene tetrahydromethanopterin reductase-like flavin-dependent oxidoreductase (luciferase family)